MDQTLLTGLAMVLGVLALIGAFIALLMGLRWLVFRLFPAFLVGPGGAIYDTTTRIGALNMGSGSHSAQTGTAIGFEISAGGDSGGGGGD